MEILYRWIDGINDVLWSYLLVALLLGCAVWFTLRTRGVQFSRPGAVFWMWVIALLGASSAFVESTLAQLYKRKGRDSYIGGPAYYMERGLGKRWMGVLFAVLISVTFGFAFNSVQSNTICAAWEGAFGFAHHWVGAGLTLLTLLVIFGGIHRVANAFGWEQAMGGGAGAALMQGIRRGLFSNEAGMGSAPNVAATAHVSHPVKQGLIQTLGVFTDTLVICTCTAFIILFGGVPDASLSGIRLTQAALVGEIGPAGSVFVAVAIFLFAFSSIIGNYYYGEANIRFITRRPWVLTLYRVLVGVMVLFGALATLDLAWSLADITMAFMTLINLVAIVLLGRQAFLLLADYVGQRRRGIKNPVYTRDRIPSLEDKAECW